MSRIGVKRRNTIIGATFILAAVGVAAWLVQEGTQEGDSASSVGVAPRAAREGPSIQSAVTFGASVSPSSSTNPTNEPPNASNWLSVYTESNDLYAFVKDTVPRALAGDHRALYFVGQALLDCKTLVVTVNLRGKKSFVANVEETMAAYQADEAARRRMTEHIRRCEGFFKSDPVADLSEEKRQFSYWRDRALAGEDAFALMDRAAQRAVGREAAHTPNGESERRSAVLGDIRQALSTHDPAVIFRVGALYTNPAFARNAEFQAPAWFLAACSAGYDCSLTNLNVGFGCVQAGECEAGLAVTDQLQRSLSPAKYAAAYAASQEILYKIGTDDWDGLEGYLDARL
jgi:hypothetical protein